MLSFELQPTTPAGRRFVEVCQACSEVFAARAADVDHNGTFPAENVEELRDRGLLAAAVPLLSERRRRGEPGALKERRGRAYLNQMRW